MATDLTAPDTAPDYTAENIKTLKDAAHIRQNPGMYIGNTSSAGLHHLVYEIVYNSVDEALAGFCSLITVTLHLDGSVSVADDGRGIPVDVKPETGRSTLEDALTVAGTSGKFDNAAYRVSAGLHGMGAKAMNALSEWTRAEVRRGGRVFQMDFEKGYATGPLQDLGPAPAGVTGTTISFKPDDEVFDTVTFDATILADRFRELAYLNPGLALALHDERDGKREQFQFKGGIAEYVAHLNATEKPEHAPIYVKKEVPFRDGLVMTVEAALQYTAGEEKVERYYTNNAFNPAGGTHQSGFRSGLTRAMTAYGRKENLFKESIELRGEDFREGLTSVVSVGHPDPLFESQTKVKLNNPEVDGAVASVVYEALTEWLEKNPKEGKRICSKIQLSAEARIAARKAREDIVKRKNLLAGGGLPGKLMDCSTKNRQESELFLVEGDSAGGSAESGRDRHYQAVLPLRGKVLNVEKAQLQKLLKNEEIGSLIAAVGVDIGNSEDVTRVRYGKVIILTDADVDGQHIRTLLLTFFFRQMRKLIETGNIFVARPPLYKVTQKKETRFVQTREEMAGELFARGLKGATLDVLAVNGRAAATVPGDKLAGLVPVLEEIDEAARILDRRGHPFADFLKKHTPAGLPLFHVRLGGKDHFLHTADEVAAFRAKRSQELGRELVVSDEVPTGPAADGSGAPAADTSDERYRFHVDEWHEVKPLNKALARLAGLGFEPGDLVPLPRVAGREPPVRFVLASGDSRKELDHLRQLVGEIRRAGEKGLTVTRFKGLGEMDPDELWETTLDPAKRTLLQVTLTDALAAEKMFRTLMGDEVDGRREFILKHRANVEDIDYGA
jgi:DNA gyrase subunit B